jgi:TRAP-type C4-dicarboxylate transport system substrate-binding protein
MMKLRNLALTGAIGVALATPAAAQTTLTFSTWVPQTHHLSIWQADWTKEIEKATAGRLKFNYLPKHPSAPPGTFDAVRDGLMDLSYVTASYTPARHALPAIAELPGAGATSVVNSVAFSRIHWKHFHKVGEYNGVKLIAVFTHGPGQMFNTKRAINSLADLKGMKIRTGGGIAEKFGNILGASAFVKPAPESYELLASGVADGVFFPLESIISFKLDKVLKHATLFPGGFYSSSFGFFMNQDKWNKLSKQDQDIIEKHGYEYAARSCGQSWDTADDKGLAGLKASGVTISNANPAFVKAVMAQAKQLDDEWIKGANAKGVDGAKVLAEFRAELKKVAAGK